MHLLLRYLARKLLVELVVVVFECVVLLRRTQADRISATRDIIVPAVAAIRDRRTVIILSPPC